MRWTDARVEELGKHIDAGLSVRKAADIMKLTHGQVEGKAYRLGWSFGTARTEEQKLQKQATRVEYNRPRPVDGQIVCYVSFDPDVISIIREKAKELRVSQPEMIRTLVAWGLDSCQ